MSGSILIGQTYGTVGIHTVYDFEFQQFLLAASAAKILLQHKYKRGVYLPFQIGSLGISGGIAALHLASSAAMSASPPPCGVSLRT